MNLHAAETSDTLVIAHWNLGHFSLGKTNRSTIPVNQADSIAHIYRQLVDSVSADIFGVCEYSSWFTKSGFDTSLMVFPHYNIDYVGPSFRYQSNAIFSNISLTKRYQHFFGDSHQKCYAAICTFFIDTIPVQMVEVHLDWSRRSDGSFYRTEQILELIDVLSPYKYVIIGGDFNTSLGLSEFEPFIVAGYNSSVCQNNGLNTYPSSNPKIAIDNILVKGFEILSTDVFADDRLSDHSLVRSRVKLIRD